MRTQGAETKAEVSAPALKSDTRQSEGTAPDTAGLSPDIRGILGLQSTAGNAAVAALIGGAGAPIAGPLDPPPHAAIPDFSTADPQEALARAGALRPGQLLVGLSGVAAAVTRSARLETQALSRDPPTWSVAPDQADGTAPAPDLPGQPRSSAATAPLPGDGSAESRQLADHHASFERQLTQVATAGARDAGTPMGEHGIVASAPAGVIRSALAPTAIEAAALPVAEEVDDGVSQVAEDEQGPQVHAAVEAGLARMSGARQERSMQESHLRAEAQREMATLESANTAARHGERQAAVEQVHGLRQAWSAEHQSVAAQVLTEGHATGLQTQSTLTEQRTAAREAADVARRQGEAEARETRRHGEQQAADERKKSQGSGGILGAIGSAARSLVDSVGRAVAAVVDRVRAAVSAVLQRAEQAARGALERGRRAMTETIGATVRALGAAAQRAGSLVAAASQRFRQAIQERVAQARATVNRLAGALRDGVRLVVDRTGAALGAVVSRLNQVWHAALQGVHSAVQGAVQFARNAVSALGTFAPLIRDVAANPGQWIANLAAGAQDGIRNHLWPDLRDAVRGWLEGKVDAVLGLSSAIWDALKRGGVTVKDVGHMLWEGIKAAIPPTLISILIEKVVSLLVPAAAAALLIVQAIQAAWASLSRILQAFDAFVHFLKSVRWGNAGPLFGKAIAAGAIAVIDFVSNFLLQRLQGPASRVGTRLRSLVQQSAGKVKQIGSLGLARVRSAIKGSLKGHEVTEEIPTHRLRQAGATTLEGGTPSERKDVSLSGEDNARRLAMGLTEKARQEATLIRAELGGMTSRQGGTLEGLEHELKSPQSLTDKIAKEIQRGSTPEEAAAQVKDALRYTVTFDKTAYSQSTKRSIADLEARGYRKILVKNSWGEGSSYPGINCTFEGPTGYRFEIQFHTSGEAGSWNLKEFATHAEYKEMTDPRTPLSRRRELYDLIVEKSRTVEIPEGVSEIGEPVRIPRP